MAISAMARRYALNHDGNPNTGLHAGPVRTGGGGRGVARRMPAGGQQLQHGPMFPGGGPGNSDFGHSHNPGRPPFPGGGMPGEQQQGGYQGLDQIFQMLSGKGLDQSQFDRMAQGYTGANGSIGGQHGAFQGLSPYAVHFLATSGLLDKQQAPQTDTTGLTGDALFKANLMNQLQGQQPGQYKLHSGIDQNTLQQMLGMIPQGAYAKGYNAQGRTNPMTGQPFQG